jgi:hypothetical protein
MSEDLVRTARCCCGAVSISVRGEPHHVHGCHCDYCQRRTGSVWQVSCWYFDHEIVSVEGETRIYGTSPDLAESLRGSAAEGQTQEIDYHFCIRCGSTVYWKIPMTAAMGGGEDLIATAIAVGCFADKDFPAPSSDHYVRNRQGWLEGLTFEHMYDELPTPDDLAEGRM